MKRVASLVVGLAIMVVLLAANALSWNTSDSTSVYEPTRITDYRADFRLEEDGDLHVTETLTVDFPDRERRGIFRFFDNADETAPSARREPMGITVTRNGRPEPFVLLEEGRGRYLNVRIGDPDNYLPGGEHTYVIGYTMSDAIQPGQGVGETSQFYWQLIPSGWQQSIDRAKLTVHLPVASALVVECAVGMDAADGCEASGAGTDTLVVRTGALRANTPVSIKTGLDVPTPDRRTNVPWPARLDRTLGTSPVLLGIVLLLALGAFTVGAVTAGRNREDNPQFPLMYAPPDGIGPAQAAYILTKRTGHAHFVASLMHAAEKGAIDLSKQGDAWAITDKAGAAGWAILDPITSRIARLLHGPGTSFVASKDVKTGKRLAHEISLFDAEVHAWAQNQGLVTGVGRGCLGVAAVNASLVAVCFIVLANPFNMTAWGLIPGAFAVAATPMLRPGSLTRRTPAGRDLWSRVGGFHRVLSTPSAQERFDFSGREELYTAYLPWAVAFGCADEWAEKYRLETHSEPPTPRYLAHSSAAAYTGPHVTRIVDDFDDTVSSAISAYQATQRSSSGSSGGSRRGGGGFSGGRGGGGGGGGSW